MSTETVQDEVISIEPRARAMLQELVGAGGRGRYVRIHVGRGWGGWSYQLSLDETADAKTDVVIEAGGIPFVAEVRQKHLVPGLRIEVQRVLGREGLVAYNVALEPSAC